MQITRIFTGEDQQSHFEDIELDLPDRGPGGKISDLVAATGVMFRQTDASYDLGFHTAPRRQYVVNLTGTVEIEVGSGEKRRLGPGTILLAEDTTGQGHISRAVGDGVRNCLFIPLA